MKLYRYVVHALVCCLFLLSCDKMDFDNFPNLKRNNPLDGKNNSNTVKGVSIKFDSYSVVYDNNSDEIVNKGETVYLFVNLKNNGSRNSNNIKATFTSSSSYISGLTPTSQVDYGSISAGSIQSYGNGEYATTPSYDSYTVKFTVSNTTPSNTKIPITITITDESGNTWTDSFEVVVVGTGANIAFDNYAVVYDNNSDEIINKGETVYLFVNLRNNGSSTANKVKATFTSSSSYVSGFTPTTQVDYGNISAGSIQGYGSGDYATTPSYDNYTVKFTLSGSTPLNTIIPINISITDESANTWTSNFNITVQ